MGLREDGKAVNVLFSQEMYDKIKADAEKRCLSVGAFIKVMVSDWYIKKEE